MRGHVACSFVLAAFGLLGCPYVHEVSGLGPSSFIKISVYDPPENGEVYTFVFCNGGSAYYVDAYVYGQPDEDGDGVADEQIFAEGDSTKVPDGATTVHEVPTEEGMTQCKVSYVVSRRTDDGGIAQKSGETLLEWPPSWETLRIVIRSDDPNDVDGWTATTSQESEEVPAF